MRYKDDRNLVERTLQGDKSAFSQLVTKYKSAVYSLAVHILKDFEDAKDIAQEAFLKAYVNLPKLRNPDRFAAWLNQITRSVAYNFLNREKEDGLISVEEISDEFSEDVPPQLQTRRKPQDEVEAKETIQFILAAFDRLSRTNRLTAMLFYMDGLTYDEIATFQDISVSTVKGRLHQARKQLREEVLSLVEQGLKFQAPGPEFVSSVMVLLKNLENSVSSINDVRIDALDTDDKGTKHVRIFAKRKGKFRIDTEDTLYVSDGKTVWQHEKRRGVLKINVTKHYVDDSGGS
ncbi:MAG: sigma-70 family RNA polymerase sigma factor [Candidatus Poribacteria bacterium]